MKYTISLILSFLVSTTFAYANEMGEGPCKKDVEQYCHAVTPGHGAIIDCLKQNADKLSTECKAHRDEMKKAWHEVKESCHADAEKFCSGVKMGEDRIHHCLKEHAAELSDACKKEVADVKTLRRDAHKK